ncbi:hypothetical protein RND71_028528 [Anisodus tanguticus]|uniref:Uncharacterized protein n=1 Tax=Anisodus tanguticus TaxID=243964 RepID=A0AAE1RJZ0_9SOLA|nr:hypothetical protein RND71_028528 [Anisodus tanguticus]
MTWEVRLRDMIHVYESDDRYDTSAAEMVSHRIRWVYGPHESHMGHVTATASALKPKAHERSCPSSTSPNDPKLNLSENYASQKLCRLECHQRRQVMLTIRVTDKSHSTNTYFSRKITGSGGFAGAGFCAARAKILCIKNQIAFLSYFEHILSSRTPFEAISRRCSRINKGISKADLSFHHIRFGYGREVGLMRSERVIDHTYTLDIDLGISICIRLEQLVAFKLRLDKIKKEVKGDILTERLKFDSNIVHEPDKGGGGNSETR